MISSDFGWRVEKIPHWKVAFHCFDVTWPRADKSKNFIKPTPQKSNRESHLPDWPAHPYRKATTCAYQKGSKNDWAFYLSWIRWWKRRPETIFLAEAPSSNRRLALVFWSIKISQARQHRVVDIRKALGRACRFIGWHNKVCILPTTFHQIW